MKKRILQIVDAPNWAIDTLAKAIVENTPQFEWKRIFVHPRGLQKGEIDLKPIIEAIEWCDVVDAQYWRSLSQLLEKIPVLKTKKIVLTHHNEKNLLSFDWKDVDMHIAKTKYSKETLIGAGYKNVVYIPNSFDPAKFIFNENYPPSEKAVGYVGRIVAWKGLKEVARACYELKVPLVLMGKPDDNDYLRSIPKEHLDNIDWSFMNCSDDERQDFYKQISVYVGNSGPNHEVGTLGFIEALAVGLPVVTTLAGLAADIGKSGDNMLMVPYGDFPALKEAIRAVLDDPELASSLRENGWRTIKNFSDQQMAWQYGNVFFSLLKSENWPLVSIVIPATFDRAAEIGKILVSLDSQDYQNIEVIVVWDEKDGIELPENVTKLNLPVRFLFTKRGGYNLAMARNLGVIEACGDIIVLCDSRFLPDDNSISLFVDRLVNYGDKKVWLFGNKRVKGELVNKKSFVENWSAIRRQHLINAGMFNERIYEYGGMSQELRSRFLAQDFKLEFCPDVIASEMIKSNSKGSKRRQSTVRMKVLLKKLGFEK